MKKKLRACDHHRQAGLVGPSGPVLRGPRRLHRRRGAVLLELIVALPILVMTVVTIVQFGFFFQNAQQLALASRVGAQEASETAALPLSGDPVPVAIVTAVTQQLSSSGIDPCAIIVEHNVNAGTAAEQTLRWDAVPACPDCEEPISGIPFRSVRVTVCVKMNELMPNCLSMLGFDISPLTSQSSTTFAYEVP